jgi:predicted ATPase
VKGYEIILNAYKRETETILCIAKDNLDYSQEYGFPDWISQSLIHLGWAMSFINDYKASIGMIEEGLALQQKVGTRMFTPKDLSRYAEAFANASQYEQALEVIERAYLTGEETGTGHHQAEALRIKGDLILRSGGDSGDAEDFYYQSLELARDQSAKWWELRTTVSLARLWQSQCKTDEARQILEEVYGWFTEGFDTADLKEAKALLDELQ